LFYRSKVYIANYDAAHTITVINTQTDQVITTLSVKY